MVRKSARRLKVVGSGIRDAFAAIGEFTGVTASPLPGENHVVFRGPNGPVTASFAGPGTDLVQRRRAGGDWYQPVRTAGKAAFVVDSASKTHDLAYEAAQAKLKSGEVDKPKYMELIHAADDVFINELDKLDGFNLTAMAAKKAIQLKKFLEKTELLDPSQFSGAGELKPTRMLRKEMDGRPKISGGFLPILLPFIGRAIIGALVSSAGEALVKHFTKSDHEGGQYGSGLTYNANMKPNEKTQYILHALDNMPHNRQLDILHSTIFSKK